MKISDPAFNYDQTEISYSRLRSPDPSIFSIITKALGNSRTVLNIGAGTGSYEPDDRFVIAVEPSERMRKQRLELNRKPAINASAMNLPFEDHSFDASMAVLTVHHWPDIKRGLSEMRRVTRNVVIILSFDPDALNTFWNAGYFPELIDVEKARYPEINFMKQCLGGRSEVKNIPIPLECTDGFLEAFYGRPEAFLNDEVRRAQSAWSFLQPGLEDKLVNRLRRDLDSGEWDHKYGQYRKMPFATFAFRMLVAWPA